LSRRSKFAKKSLVVAVSGGLADEGILQTKYRKNCLRVQYRSLVESVAESDDAFDDALEAASITQEALELAKEVIERWHHMLK
jgi:hypothetical protein